MVAFWCKNELKKKGAPLYCQPVTELKIKSFLSAASFRRWLVLNHARSEGIWIKFYKKSSGKKTIVYSEAVDQALCFGWIDSQAKSLDETCYLQKYTPRRARSVWSKINIGRVKRLTAAGLMKPAGLQAVQSAQEDGRWKRAYDSPKNAKIPPDFVSALKRNKTAEVFFKTLNRTNVYAIIWRLQTAKKPETRERRIKMIVAMLSRGEKFHG